MIFMLAEPRTPGNLWFLSLRAPDYKEDNPGAYRFNDMATSSMSLSMSLSMFRSALQHRPRCALTSSMSLAMLWGLRCGPRGIRKTVFLC